MLTNMLPSLSKTFLKPGYELLFSVDIEVHHLLPKQHFNFYFDLNIVVEAFYCKMTRQVKE